jgi:transcription initiation factor TFIIIB Brf1 subunit/transcription initiation factor TFIIB
VLATCSACESAQDVEKAGLICWFCGLVMGDPWRDHTNERGGSPDTTPEGAKRMPVSGSVVLVAP